MNISIKIHFKLFHLGDEVRGRLRGSSGLFFEGSSIGPDLERTQRKGGFAGKDLFKKNGYFMSLWEVKTKFCLRSNMII